MLRYLLCILSLCSCGFILQAHPMPNSVLLLDVKSNGIVAELQWPLKELQLAFPEEDIDRHPETLLQRKQVRLHDYLLQHMRLSDSAGNLWTITIDSNRVLSSEQAFTGTFHELVFYLWLQPPAGSSPRHFSLQYSAIMHQLVTHKMLIRIRQDWDGGLSEKDSLDADLGLLMVNTSDGKIPPVQVNLEEGSKWKGFKNMLSMGMEHIAEGTDHLLFLLVLLLSAPLLLSGKKWGAGSGKKQSIIKLLKIATAFTVGHSITLLAGAIGYLRLPSQPVEVLIAISILLSAIHALRPLFPGKEVFIAAGFGLVHGLAFTGVLSDLHLDGMRMALSILGFNIGIELMQLFIILLFVPWLIILSAYPVYKLIRIVGALFGIVASLAWIIERLADRSNVVTDMVQQIAQNGQWIVLILAMLAIGVSFTHKSTAAST